MPINEYLVRLQRHFECSPEALFVASVYCQRVLEIEGHRLHSKNAHRLLLSALVVAAKYQDDDYFYNTHYAKIGGLSLAELNKLESELLRKLNWQMYVSSERHLQAVNEVVQWRANQAALSAAVDQPVPESPRILQEEQRLGSRPSKRCRKKTPTVQVKLLQCLAVRAVKLLQFLRGRPCKAKGPFLDGLPFNLSRQPLTRSSRIVRKKFGGHFRRGTMSKRSTAIGFLRQQRITVLSRQSTTTAGDSKRLLRTNA